MSHQTYDLEAINETTVTITCAEPGCLAPLGEATILTWGAIAEAHYREKVSGGIRVPQ